MAVSCVKPDTRWEALAGIGTVLGILLIPFFLDGRWSAPILALEGAVLVWAGAVQKRVLVRHLGLLLQVAAGFIFADSVWYPLFAAPFVNYYFLGCICLSLAALASSYFLDRYHGLLQRLEKHYSAPVMILGIVWWYIGGLREVDMQIPRHELTNGFLMFCCASSIVMGKAGKKLDWPRFRTSMYVQLPVMALFALLTLFGAFSGRHLFAGWGAVTWTVALAVQYRLLSRYARDWPRKWMYVGYLGTILLLNSILWCEILWGGHRASPSGRWSLWAVLVLWGGLLFLLLRNLIREIKTGGPKKECLK